MWYVKFTFLWCLIVLTIDNIQSSDAEGKGERFSNFYTAPADLELIAMASEGSSTQQKPSDAEKFGKPINSPSSSSEHQRESTLVASSLSSSSTSSKSSQSSSSEEDDSGEPRFSIGLGTLAPSYSQKFGLDGNTRLDFDHHVNGFSYTLTNHHHPESDLSKDEYFGQSSNQLFSRSESNHPNVKIYYDQRFHSIPPPPLSSAAESKNFFSALPPSSRSFDFSPSSLSKSNKIPDESRFRELVDKYAPKEEEDSLESFFKRDPSPKGSWSSLSDGPSFDHMPHDMPDDMPEHHHPRPSYDSESHKSQSSAPTPPPSHHHSAPRHHPHSSQHSNAPRAHDRPDDHHHNHRHHPHPHSHPHQPPPPPPPPHHHHSSPEGSYEPPREKYYDDPRGRYEESPRGSNEYNEFDAPAPYIGSGSDLDDEEDHPHDQHHHESNDGSSGPIQFNSNIHHGTEDNGLSFNKDNTIITGTPGAHGFEYVNRITTNSHEEVNPFQFGANSFEPVVFTSNHIPIGFNENHQQDGFASYIAGLPFTP